MKDAKQPLQIATDWKSAIRMVLSLMRNKNSLLSDKKEDSLSKFVNLIKNTSSIAPREQSVVKSDKKIIHSNGREEKSCDFCEFANEIKFLSVDKKWCLKLGHVVSKGQKMYCRF